VAAVNYASVTVSDDGAYTTVAASSDVAIAVDEAQYADSVGPCLQALDDGHLVAVPEVAATMRWPGFRDTAFSLGLRATLSIPLFAGRGAPIAALNLYSHDCATMARLTAAVRAAYEVMPAETVDGTPELDSGGAELVAGLVAAFAVRAVINQAIGVVMVDQSASADSAYLVLRLRAAESGLSLGDTASAVIAEQLW